MTERVFAQMAVAFLLGVWGYQDQNCLVFVCWACYLGWLLFVWNRQRRQRDCRREQGCGGRFARIWLVVRLAVCLLCLGLGFCRHHQYQAMAKEVKLLLEGADLLHISGTIDQKEEKNGTFIYHLNHSIIYHQESCSSGGRILVYHDADAYSIGDTIQVTGKKMELRKARNEGNFDEASYEYGRGIFCKVKAEEMALIRRPGILWKEALYQLRRQMAQVYMRHLPKEEAGVIGVMALGEKTGLYAPIKEMYQESGISHVLAVSGLHISLLGMGLYRFLRKRGAAYGIAGGIAGAAVVCFGQITGMGLSARRAVLMFLVLLLANVLGMAYDSVTALFLAVVLQLWEYPKSLWQAGFLFSYGAVLAVVVVSPIIREFCICQKACLGQSVRAKRASWEDGFRKKARSQKKRRKSCFWARRKRAFWDMLLISGCIQLVMLPLTAYAYYEVPVYGLLANILLLPFMGLLLAMGLLGGILGLVNPVLAGICFKIVQLLLGWNAWVCVWIGRLPGAVWITGRPNSVWMAGCYVIFAWVLYRMNRWTRREKEMRRKGAGQQSVENRYVSCSIVRKLLLCGIPVAAVILLLKTAGMKGDTQVCFLDVGQGDGIFFQGDKASFFLDGGSTSESGVGKYRILPFLKYRGFDSVDGWFLSHGDQDHISGLQELWEEGYNIKCLFLAEGMVKDEAWKNLCRQAREHGTRICYLKPGDTVGTASLRLTCLYPWKEGTDRNEASMVLKMDIWEKGRRQQKVTGLFAGDIGEEQEKLLVEQYPDLTVHLYKASHHGSNGSNSQAFLKQLHPKATIISCGERNNYGHPGKEAVARIVSCGSGIWYTKDSGQITVECREGNLQIKAFLQE